MIDRFRFPDPDFPVADEGEVAPDDEFVKVTTVRSRLSFALHELDETTLRREVSKLIEELV